MEVALTSDAWAAIIGAIAGALVSGVLFLVGAAMQHKWSHRLKTFEFEYPWLRELIESAGTLTELACTARSSWAGDDGERFRDAQLQLKKNAGLLRRHNELYASVRAFLHSLGRGEELQVNRDEVLRRFGQINKALDKIARQGR